MEKTILKNILDRVSDVTKKYAEVAKITGENFNIFRILKIEASEVRVHSAFIAELLSPFGRHGQGSIFLKIFLNLQREKQKEYGGFLERFKQFDSSQYKVFIEQHIGQKNEDETEGGRIDILLTDRNNSAIVIENKIYAGEQKNFLVRYNNAYKEAPIFYLTLHANSPDSNNKGSLSEGVDFVNISYKEDIKLWLEVCVKEAAAYPLLRETIQQYIFLLNYLTNQTNNDKMKTEIEEIVLDKLETLDAFFSICSIKGDVQRKILGKLNEQLQIFADQNGFKLQNEIQSESTKEKGFYFDSNELKPLRIGFQFGETRFKDFFFGFKKFDENQEDGIDYEQLKSLFIKYLGQPFYRTPWWPAYTNFKGYENWNDDTFKRIFTGDFAREVNLKVKALTEVIKDYKKKDI